MGDDGKRIAGGLLTKQYNDAEGIAQNYAGQKKALMDKHLSAAATPEEYEELRLYFEKDFQNNYDRVAQHQLKQERATSDLLTGAYNTTALQKIAANPEELASEMPGLVKKNKENWTQNGLPKEVQDANLFALHGKAISAAVGTYLERNQTAQAADLLAANRDKLDAKTGATLAAQVKKAVVNDTKTQLWNDMQKHRTATGEVSLSYARRIIDDTGFEQSIKDDLLKDVEARMADEKRFKDQQNRQRDENFYAEADKLVNGNGTLTDGLKLAEQFANDSKDKFTKEKFIENLFKEHSARGHATQSDPEEYLRLWKGINDGNVTEDDVKESFNTGFITATDYRGLVKDIYRSPEDKQEISFALKQIEANAKKTIPDKEDRDIFMLEVRRQSQGKSVQEMFAIAKDLQGKQGGFMFMGGTPKYQKDNERNTEQQRITGKHLQDGGDLPTFNAFVKYMEDSLPAGVSFSQRPWTAKDWDDFKKKYPGIEKQGTMENMALLGLVLTGKVIDDENLAAAIDIAYERVGQKSTRQLEREQKDKKAKESAASLKKQMELFNKLRVFKTPADLIPGLADEAEQGPMSPVNPTTPWR